MLKKENSTWKPLSGGTRPPRDQIGFDSSSAEPSWRSSPDAPPLQKNSAARYFGLWREAGRWISRYYERKLRTITTRRALGYAFTLLLVGAIAYLVLAQTSTSTRQGAGIGFVSGGRVGRDAPVPVLAATAKTADVPVYFDGVGTTRALNTVTVRPQVDGRLLSINFHEGQEVERGFVLAEIDPIIYQAQLDQAVAKKAQDEAQLANARLDLERYTRLAQSNAATKQQADTQSALVAQIEAVVNADQAAIDNARAVLSYTKVIAPIGGRTGIRLVDVGNLMRAADSTGIVVITQVRPISVIFTLPQQQLGAVNKAFAEGALSVLALDADDRTVLDRGALQVVDNQVDQTTGTVRYKAEFPNAALQLWPGQFANVKLLVDTLRGAIVVPTGAVQRGPNGPFAYVVTERATVAVRPITVAQQDDTQAVIASGLSSDERVVTSGFTQLTDGSRVAVANSGSAEELRRDRPRADSFTGANSDSPQSRTVHAEPPPSGGLGTRTRDPQPAAAKPRARG
jgi:multidrug efflux system membrane fusion protein